MQLELSDSEARLVRALAVRHLVELEEEFSRTREVGLNSALSSRLTELRALHDKLTSVLEPPSMSMRTAASSRRQPA